MVKQHAQGHKDSEQEDSLEAMSLTTTHYQVQPSICKQLQQTFGDTLEHLLLKLSHTKS